MSIQLEKLLPPYNFRIDDAVVSGRGWLDLFVNDVLQPVLDQECAEQRRWIDQQSVDTADSQTINAILADLGNPFSVALNLPLNRRRLLARVLVDIYKTKGTAGGLVDVIFALTGIQSVVVFPATVDAFVLDEDHLSDTEFVPAIGDPNVTEFGFLGSNPEFLRYSFQIDVAQTLTAEEEEIIREIVLLMKPAHTHFLGFITPGASLVIDHWELGLSFLTQTGSPLQGDETDIHL